MFLKLKYENIETWISKFDPRKAQKCQNLS